jgi:hypothetical protein
MIKIIDNFLDDTVNKMMEKELTKSTFPWYCIKNVTSDDFKNFAFFHQFVENSKINSDRYKDLIIPIINKILSDNLVDINYVCDRIKTNLYTNQGKQIKHNFHTDIDKKHLVVLYSINDNNGYTELETGEKIMSKRNRLAIFDGMIKHRSVTQTDTNFRINYNFNFLMNEI